MSNTPRVGISLSGDEREALTELARRRGEPRATTAARLVRAGLVDEGAVLDEPPKRRRGPAVPEESKVAWLPPSARQAAIDALKDRYPHDLKGAPADLSSDRLAAERLAALSVWRDELDSGLRPDAREELAFAAELSAVAKWLEDRGRRRLAGSRGV